MLRPRPPFLRDILGVTAVVSACSLVYEMSIASCFAMLTGDAVLWHSVTIALYLSALGAGSYAASKRVSPDPWPLFLRVETALAAAGALAPGVILSAETLYRLYFRFWRDYSAELDAAPYALLLALCHGWTVLIGYLSGFEIPLMIRAASAAPHMRSNALPDGAQYGVASAAPGRPGNALGQVLAANYAGALAGCLAFGFVLQPLGDVTGPCLAAAAVNLGVCAWLWARGVTAPERAQRVRLAAAAAVLALSAGLTGPLFRFHLVNFYAGAMEESGTFRSKAARDGRRASLREAIRRIAEFTPAVEHSRSRYQHIDLVTEPGHPTARDAHYNGRLAAEPDWPAGLTLYLDRRYQFRGATEALYHEFMAHVPIQLFGRVPRDVLILGGGDGLLARELLKYGSLRSITNVELDGAMIALAREDPRLRRMNGDSLRDPRVRVVTDDAFFFIRIDPNSYDAVYVDLPYPNSYDVARLYSVEFFRNVARLLRPGGALALDFPLRRQDDKTPPEEYEINSIIGSTLRAAGFKTIVPYTTQAPELVSAKIAPGLGIVTPDTDPEINRLLRRVDALRFARRGPGAAPSASEDLAVLDAGEIGETMLAATIESRWPVFRFTDHAIPLFALTPARLGALKLVRFPWRDEPRLANTVLKPMLFDPEHIEDFALR